MYGLDRMLRVWKNQCWAHLFFILIAIDFNNFWIFSINSVFLNRVWSREGNSSLLYLLQSLVNWKSRFAPGIGTNLESSEGSCIAMRLAAHSKLTGRSFGYRCWSRRRRRRQVEGFASTDVQVLGIDLEMVHRGTHVNEARLISSYHCLSIE